MARRKAFAALPAVLLIPMLLPAAAGAEEGWASQRYAVRSELEADGESLAHPSARNLALVVPADLPGPEVCVGNSTRTEGGLNEVTVIVSRLGPDGESFELERLFFSWRDGEQPPIGERCQEVVSLVAGDLIEFRFRFSEKEPLRLYRRGRVLELLPRLNVTGWVQTYSWPL